MTDTLTAKTLYEIDPLFRMGVDAWVADRRCDIRLVDVLLEHGLIDAADCARWAATEPDRRGIVEKGEFGPVPSPCDNGGDYHWFPSWSMRNGGEDYQPHAHEFPDVNGPKEIPYHKTRSDAILWLLDNWRPEVTT